MTYLSTTTAVSVRNVKPARADFALILRRAAIEIARRGVGSFNDHELDRIGLAVWSLRNCLQYGEPPTDANGRPWPKSEV